MVDLIETDEVILSNEVSREGTQTLHVVRMGKAPEVTQWIELLQEGAWDSLKFLRWVDAIKVYHLVMIWNVRGMQEITVSQKGVWGVMWWIVDGQRMSEAIREAAERYFLDLGRDPGVAVCRAIPKSAPKENLHIPVLGSEIEMELIEADWAPKNSVVLLQKEEVVWLTNNR